MSKLPPCSPLLQLNSLTHPRHQNGPDPHERGQHQHGLEDAREADLPANSADPDRNLALELVRATEAAAIACSRYMGLGDKEQVDQAAVDAMRPALGSVRMNGVVVIGEGKEDEAPMLFNGEHGGGSGPKAALDGGYDLNRILTTADLVSGDNVFFAAVGVTDGAFLRGVRFEAHRVVTQSLSMRSRSGTIRLIEGRHDPERSLLIN
jgi:fructose-1,6-bisphosphatase/sedoheptulose 1,7-bisphosphatase-like protein